MDPAIPISLRTDNALTLTDGLSIYDGDEMSFGFLYNVSTCIATGEWSTTNVSGDFLYTKHIIPRELCEIGVKTVGAVLANYGVGPPIYYFSNLFTLWRGSINITIKIPKTDFHSGRLQVTWTPSASGINVPSLIDSQYSLREIIDIKSGNEFSFNLPWMLEQNYISTASKSGIFSISVLNELRAPETASQTVELLVYVSGGKDYELQLPGNSGGTSGYLSLPFSPQMETGDDLIVKGGIAGEVVSNHETLYSEESTGEMPVSIKQFLNRNSQLYFKVQTAYTNSISIYPWFNAIPYLTGAGLTSQNVGGDISMYLAPLYAFYRGSVKLTLLTNADATVGHVYNRNVVYTLVPETSVTPTIISAGAIYGAPTSISWIASTSLSGLQGNAIHQGDIPLSSVHIPYIGTNKCSLNLLLSTAATVANDKANPKTKVNAFAIAGFPTYSLFRSYGEDFQYSFFLGCPPVLRA